MKIHKQNILLSFIILLSITSAAVGNDLQDIFFNSHEPDYQLTKKPENSVRIMSWNVRHFKNVYGDDKLDEIFNSFDKSEANVINIQEAHQNYNLINGMLQPISHEWEERFKTIKNNAYKVYKCHAEPVKKDGSYKQLSLAVATDLEVEDVSCHVFPDSLQYEFWPESKLAFMALNINTDQFGSMLLINTHLDVMDHTGVTRLKQIKMILDFVNDNKRNSNIPIFITGDFNSIYASQLSGDELLKIMKQDANRNVPTSIHELLEFPKQGYSEVYDAAKIAPPKVSVWSQRRVDYIFTKNITGMTLQPKTIPWAFSDHYPLVLDLTLNKD